MKKVAIILFALAMGLSVNYAMAQQIRNHVLEVRMENHIDKREAKKSNKKAQKAQLAAQEYAEARKILEERDFVMEANKVSMPDGTSLAVFSDVNYLMMKGENAIVQFNPGISGGPNGMGGITLEGRVMDLRQTEDKRGNVILKYTVFSTAGSADVELTLLRGGNKANAVVSQKMHSGRRVMMFGKMVPTENSRVFKGFSM